MDLKPKIQILQSNEIDKLNELITVFETVFEMQKFNRPSEFHLQKLLEKETLYAVVALNDNKVIGGLTFYVLDQYYSEKPLAYIYDLAVLTEYQRKGVGKNLINHTIEYCKQKGFEEVFVQADKIDDYAIDFYRFTTPTNEAPVVHFSYYFGTSQTPKH